MSHLANSEEYDFSFYNKNNLNKNKTKNFELKSEYFGRMLYKCNKLSWEQIITLI